MKTTLNIDDSVMAQLKREAARQRRTMLELVETALRLLLQAQKSRIYTRDTDFHRFPFLEVVDPLQV